MVGSMAACRQTWSWNQECSYRQQEIDYLALSIGNVQQGHTSSNKATPPNSATSYEMMGANYIQTTQTLFIQMAQWQNMLAA